MQRLALLLVVLGACLVGSSAWAQDTPVGILRVVSSVPNSLVHIDYEQVGEAPLVNYLPPGQHTIRISADGHDPFVRRVEVLANQTTEVSARLRPGKGSVEFFVRPLGAVVELDDQEVGPTPIRLNKVTEGTHVYKVRSPRHETVEGTFEFVVGLNILLFHELESSAGRFAITSSPEGATVWLDGRRVGETPLNMRDVELGEHTVRVEAEGYATVLRRLDTSDGSKGVVQARLTEKGIVVVLKTGSGDGSASVEGQRMGTGRRVQLELEKGRYDLALTAPDKGTVEGTLKADGGRSIWKADYKAGELVEVPPMYRRWTFWTAVGVVAGGGTTAAVLLTRELEPEPEPLPVGDLVVALP